MAAKDFADDIGQNGIESTVGSKGDTLNDRLQKYGTPQISMSQSNLYEQDKAMNILIDALVADGNPKRTSRAHILSPMHGRIGVSIAPHKTRKFVTIIVYCGYFHRKGEESVLDRAMKMWSQEPIPKPPVHSFPEGT